MKTFLRIILAVAFLFIALSFYSYGNTTGAFIFVVLGFCFEGLFWFQLFGKKKRVVHHP